MSERDDSRHLAPGAGPPASGTPDVVQAVVDFVEDLVEDLAGVDADAAAEADPAVAGSRESEASVEPEP